MSSDKERIHRWLTQAELEQMQQDAEARGMERMRHAVIVALETLGSAEARRYADIIRAVEAP